MSTSSRAYQLLEQRSKYKAYNLFGDNRKILSPVNTSVSTIARRTLTAETDSMVNKYNNGQVSNQDMYNFLTQQVNNPSLTEADKVDLQAKIDDFNVLIKKDKLEAVFKAAPEKSLTQIQAAQALARFYTDRANGMQVDTPAQSQAKENAAIWTQKALDVQTSIDKEQRSIFRAQTLNNAAMVEPGTVEEARANAKAFQDIATQARADGAEAEALNYETKAQNELNKIPNLQDKTTKEQIRLKASQWDSEISLLKNNSPSELEKKMQKAYDIAEQFRQMGDQINYNHYTAIYNDAKEKYQKMLEGDPKQAMMADVNTVLGELRDIESAYKNGKSITDSEGNSFYISGADLAERKTRAYDTITTYLEKGINSGVKNLEDDLRRYKDSYDKAVEEHNKFETGEWVDVHTKSGMVTSVDVSDPKVRQQYAQGDRLWYKLQNPTSTIPGRTSMTQDELEAMNAQGRAQLLRDEFGNVTDKAGKPVIQNASGKWVYAQLDPETQQPMIDETTGKPMETSKLAKPGYQVSPYVELRTPNGPERLWQTTNEKGDVAWVRDTNQYNLPEVAGSEQIKSNPQALNYYERFLGARPKAEEGQNGQPFSQTTPDTINKNDGVIQKAAPYIAPSNVSSTDINRGITEGAIKTQNQSPIEFKYNSQPQQSEPMDLNSLYKSSGLTMPSLSTGLTSNNQPYKVPDIQQAPTNYIDVNKTPGLTTAYTPPKQQSSWLDDSLNKVKSFASGILNKIKFW